MSTSTELAPVLCAGTPENGATQVPHGQQKPQKQQSVETNELATAPQKHIRRYGETLQKGCASEAPAHDLWCGITFCRDFESVGDASLLRLRPANLRCNHCLQCQVWSLGTSPMFAGTTSMEPWRVIKHWHCGSGRNHNFQAACCREVLHRGPTVATRRMSATECRLPVNGLVEVTGKHDCVELRAEVADEQQQRDAHGSRFGAFMLSSYTTLLWKLLPFAIE